MLSCWFCVLALVGNKPVAWQRWKKVSKICVLSSHYHALTDALLFLSALQFLWGWRVWRTFRRLPRVWRWYLPRNSAVLNESLSLLAFLARELVVSCTYLDKLLLLERYNVILSIEWPLFSSEYDFVQSMTQNPSITQPAMLGSRNYQQKLHHNSTRRLSVCSQMEGFHCPSKSSIGTNIDKYFTPPPEKPQKAYKQNHNKEISWKNLLLRCLGLIIFLASSSLHKGSKAISDPCYFISKQPHKVKFLVVVALCRCSMTLSSTVWHPVPLPTHADHVFQVPS